MQHEHRLSSRSVLHASLAHFTAFRAASLSSPILKLVRMGVFPYPPETSAPFRGDMEKPSYCPLRGKNLLTLQVICNCSEGVS
jgi:hypothetical protein